MTTADLDRYPLGHSDTETRRLVLQHQIYGPFTRRFLRDAGVTAGMRVLDLGSGAGDVTLLLAELVGPQGRVVGLDANPDLLALAARRADAAGWATVTFDQADLDHLDPAADLAHEFDALVGRWVLMFLADPAALLGRLRCRLRPGGVVAFQESDLTTPVRSFPRLPLHDELSRLLSPVGLADDGAGLPDGEMGLKLFATFVEAGLPVPRLQTLAPAGGGPDWPGYAYVAATVRSLLPHLERFRPLESGTLRVETLEQRLRDEIVAADAIQILTPVVTASTRT